MTFLGIPATLFPLGHIVTTPGAAHACTIDHLTECLLSHAGGDWGCVSPVDAAENTLAVRSSARILSAYPIDPNMPCQGFGENCLWIITEADRSATTLLLPSEY